MKPWKHFVFELSATILGIAITLGIGQYLNHRHKDKIMDTTLESVLWSLQGEIELNRNDSEVLKKNINTITRIVQMGKDSLDYMDEELMIDFINSLIKIRYFLDDLPVQDMLSGLTPLLQSTHDISQINSVCKLATLVSTVSDRRIGLEEEIYNHARPHLIRHLQDNRNPQYPRKVVESVLSDPEAVYYYQRDMIMQASIVFQGIQSAEEGFDYILNKLHLSQADLDKYDD